MVFSMKITKRFLLDHRTKNKAWTHAQFRILGLTWPPVKGWMSLVKDKELTGAETAEFILAKSVAARPKTTIEKQYLGIIKGLGKLSKGKLIMLRDEINKEVK